METQLFEAIELGRLDTIRSLLSQGVNINAKNSDGSTVLHLAMMKIRDAIINNKSYNERNEMVEKTKEIVKCLIDGGADMNLQDSQGKSALTMILFPLWSAFRVNDIIRMMIEAGANVNDSSANGNTSLHVAAGCSDLNLIKILISRGANANAKNNNNETPLHSAADNLETEDPEIFKILLSAGAYPDAKNSQGQTPLHYLGGMVNGPGPNGSLKKILIVFLKHGANFRAKDDIGTTPLRMATRFNCCETDFPEVVQDILQGRTNWSDDDSDESYFY